MRLFPYTFPIRSFDNWGISSESKYYFCLKTSIAINVFFVAVHFFYSLKPFYLRRLILIKNYVFCAAGDDNIVSSAAIHPNVEWLAKV